MDIEKMILEAEQSIADAYGPYEMTKTECFLESIAKSLCVIARMIKDGIDVTTWEPTSPEEY